MVNYAVVRNFNVYYIGSAQAAFVVALVNPYFPVLHRLEFFHGAVELHRERGKYHGLYYEIERVHFVTLYGVLRHVGNEYHYNAPVRFAYAPHRLHSV